MNPALRRALERLGIIPGSPAAKRIVAEINKLAGTETLPTPDDVEDIMPPVRHVWSHAVPTTGYVVLYTFNAELLTAWSVRVRPPT